MDNESSSLLFHLRKGSERSYRCRSTSKYVSSFFNRRNNIYLKEKAKRGSKRNRKWQNRQSPLMNEKPRSSILSASVQYSQAANGLTCFRLSRSPTSSGATFRPSLYVSIACTEDCFRNGRMPPFTTDNARFNRDLGGQTVTSPNPRD